VVIVRFRTMGFYETDIACAVSVSLWFFQSTCKLFGLYISKVNLRFNEKTDEHIAKRYFLR